MAPAVVNRVLEIWEPVEDNFLSVKRGLMTEEERGVAEGMAVSLGSTLITLCDGDMGLAVFVAGTVACGMIHLSLCAKDK